MGDGEQGNRVAKIDSIKSSRKIRNTNTESCVSWYVSVLGLNIDMRVLTSSRSLRVFLISTFAACMHTRRSLHQQSQHFFSLPMKAVVGASNDRSKFGNKVLRCYQSHGQVVVPINKKQSMIEGLLACKIHYDYSRDCITHDMLGLECIASLTDLHHRISQGLYPSVRTFHDVGISIITPPGVTTGILREGFALGARHFFLQPGTYDAEVDEVVNREMEDAVCIKGCVLVELGFSDNDAW